MTQVVGKIRLACSPWLNHGWHVALYVTARGLTTSQIPHGGRWFRIDFDLVDHRLVITCDGGGERVLPLAAGTIAHFFSATMDALETLGLPVRINTLPNEVADPVRFPDDRRPRPYDPVAVTRFHTALAHADRVFARFRTGFVGKASPVHFFWGSFDLAVTRFSGRRAPPHPGGVPGLPDAVTREAYSHEVSSAGFWPGSDAYPRAAFYSYAYPVPHGFAEAAVAPAAARFDAGLGEFLLDYDEVAAVPDPDAALLAFLQSTYAAAADRGGWDRDALDRPIGGLGKPGAF